MFISYQATILHQSELDKDEYSKMWEGRIGNNGIVLTKMGSESTVCVFKTCCVVHKSLSKSLKKLRLKVCLDGENASLNAECAFTIITNVYISFSTEFWKNVLSDLTLMKTYFC